MSEILKCRCGFVIEPNCTYEFDDVPPTYRRVCPKCGRSSIWTNTPEDADAFWNADRLAEEKAREALESIAEGAGPYSRDPLTHASNCIDAMKAIAREALALLKEE